MTKAKMLTVRKQYLAICMRNRCWRVGQSDFRRSSMVAVILSIAAMTALVSIIHQSGRHLQ
jgi:hypothetical protein